MKKIDEATLKSLPENLQIAQRAIETKEVQDIVKQLAKYNLGICMPHMHSEDGKLTELPKNMIQVERQLVASFVPESEVSLDTMIPVVWRWFDGTVVSASSCAACGACCAD